MKGFLTAIALFVCLWSCTQKPEHPPATLAELQTVTAAKSPQQIATYVFGNYGCTNCHTLGAEGKFGFTRQGEQLKSKSEGCVAMLTAMHGIAALPEVRRTAEHKEKLAHFNQYGCTACHRVSYGTVELTEVGTQLRTLHMACTDVEKILNQRAGN
jgi:cytochrome c551/c552